MGQHVEGFTIYAVDFDGTLCEHKFPGIGAPNMKLIKWLINKREAGDKVILWTNRMGINLENAVAWCKDQGLCFDAVNDNIPEVMERYKDVLQGQAPSRKITADVFIDDAACRTGLPFMNTGCSISDCWNGSCTHRCQSGQNTIDPDALDNLAKQILALKSWYGEDAFNQVICELGYSYRL